MACFSPKTAYQHHEGGRLEFREPLACGDGEYKQLKISCRKCIGCRKAHARDWGIRCWHESKMHAHSVAITLTYDQEHLPADGGLEPREIQLWLKRLRFELDPQRVRFFNVGEFGERRHRPHYHCILFGYGFPDRKMYGKSQSGFPLYSSAMLSKSWGKGIAVFNDLTLESAMYAAQYALKKVGEHSTPDFRRNQQEFARMSRMPGIGHAFLERYYSDVFRRDWCGVVVPGGKELPVPEYYLRVLRAWCEDDYLAIKERRMAQAVLRFAESQPDRLSVRQECAQAAVRFGSRKSARSLF